MPQIEIDEKLIRFLVFLPLFFLSLSIHEFAHGFFAKRFGDDTAYKQGRLTLNPVKHIDLVGSIIMPILSFLSGYLLIGWARPVPVDRRNFSNPYRDDAIVSAAGPLSNLTLSVIFFILLIIFESLFSVNDFWKQILWTGVYFNVFLCCFNLLPIPPLDGSHIIFDLFPNKFTAKMMSLGFYGTLILFLFIYSPLWGIFMNFVNLILKFFLLIKGSF